MRLAHLLIVGALAISSAYTQYQVYVGDRDQQLGVRLFDPSNNSLSVFGACSSPSYYYGLEIDRRTGDLWVCDHLNQQIVRLDRAGNCLGTFSTAQYGYPTGLSIHPSGAFLHVTFQNDLIATFSIAQNRFIAFQRIRGANSLYGLQWSPSGQYLYVCDFGGGSLYQLQPTSYPPISFTVVSSLATPSNLTARNPYDVAVRHLSASPPGDPETTTSDFLYVTLSEGYYGYTSHIAYTGIIYPGGTLSGWGTILNHPLNNTGTACSFFGITYEASDNSLWVSDYVRGSLYQVTNPHGTATITLRATFPGSPSNKPGVGIDTFYKCAAGTPSCPEDITQDGIVDDADLLAVLFAFGTSCQ